jgi:hypothetical protein
MHLLDYVLLALATAAGLAAAGGGIMLTLSPLRFRAIRVAFWFAGACFGVLGILWGSSATEYPLSVRLAAAGITAACAAIALTYMLAVVKTHEQEESKKEVAKATMPEPHPLVFQAQFAEMRRLEGFFGGKDENDLRELFDLNRIIKKNIEVQNIRINYIRSGIEKEFFYSNYTDNGSFIMWAKEGKYTVGPNGVHVDAGPLDVLYLVTTNTFQTAQRQIVEFENSALIPEQVKGEIRAFKKIVGEDAELMMRVMDEKMHQDQNYFLRYLDMGGPFHGVIMNEYATRFMPLKPAADRILSAIAKNLKIQ